LRPCLATGLPFSHHHYEDALHVVNYTLLTNAKTQHSLALWGQRGNLNRCGASRRGGTNLGCRGRPLRVAPARRSAGRARAALASPGGATTGPAVVTHSQALSHLLGAEKQKPTRVRRRGAVESGEGRLLRWGGANAGIQCSSAAGRERKPQRRAPPMTDRPCPCLRGRRQEPADLTTPGHKP
jgi:hypothetical protein